MIMHATFEKDMELAAVMEENAPMDAEFQDTTTILTPQYHFGAGLIYEPETRTVSVDIAEAVTAGDHRPVSSAAVQVQVGNIEALLQTI